MINRTKRTKNRIEILITHVNDEQPIRLIQQISCNMNTTSTDL